VGEKVHVNLRDRPKVVKECGRLSSWGRYELFRDRKERY